MLVDNRNRVAHNLIIDGAAVSVQMQLLQMIAQLIEQAFAQIAAGNALWVELAYHFKRLVQIGDVEVYGRNSCGRSCSSRASIRTYLSTACAVDPNLRRNLLLSLAVRIKLNIGLGANFCTSRLSRRPGEPSF